MTEDEMVSWHHQLNGHEFEQTSGNNEGRGSLGCWDHVADYALITWLIMH